jgi:predicted 2-oxoglutarate/Fe(II)-dependent dioxygenase YbiX
MTPVTTGSPYIFVYNNALDSANCDLINAWVVDSDMVTNTAYATANAWEHATATGQVSDSNVRHIITEYRNNLVDVANTAFSKEFLPESSMLMYWRNNNSMHMHSDAIDVANVAPEHANSIPVNSSVFMREVTSITFTNDGFTGGEVSIQVEPYGANTTTYTVTPTKGTVVMFSSHCLFSVNTVTSGANSMITLPIYFTSNANAIENIV